MKFRRRGSPGRVVGRRRDAERADEAGTPTCRASDGSSNTAASIASPARPTAARPSSAVVAERGDNFGSAIARLLRLLDAIGASDLEEALVEMLERDTILVGAVRQVIDGRRSERRLPLPSRSSGPGFASTGDLCRRSKWT
ncbi:hypothetical protein WME94_32420 [Sorangium sp. So ce429]